MYHNYLQIEKEKGHGGYPFQNYAILEFDRQRKKYEDLQYSNCIEILQFTRHSNSVLSRQAWRHIILM